MPLILCPHSALPAALPSWFRRLFSAPNHAHWQVRPGLRPRYAQVKLGSCSFVLTLWKKMKLWRKFVSYISKEGRHSITEAGCELSSQTLQNQGSPLGTAAISTWAPPEGPLRKFWEMKALETSSPKQGLPRVNVTDLTQLLSAMKHKPVLLVPEHFHWRGSHSFSARNFNSAFKSAQELV